MKWKTKELIEALEQKTLGIIVKVKEFKALSDDKLNFKETENNWSALECVEHLNLYAEFYNPVLKKSITESLTNPNECFKSGVIGNYFVRSMYPKKKWNKMKTSKDKNPSGSTLDKYVLDRFIQHQHVLLDIITASREVNLTKTKTAISISKLIKLRLGDTLRFVVAHNERHIMQAEKTLGK